MDSVFFTVKGEVMGKPRPRVNRNGRVWTPKKFTDCENRIAEAYLAEGGGLMDGEIRIEIDVFRSLPKSRPKKVESEPDTLKPDPDNIAKLVLDALNGVAYRDDSQVTQLEVTKHPRKRRDEYMSIIVWKVRENG